MGPLQYSDQRDLPDRRSHRARTQSLGGWSRRSYEKENPDRPVCVPRRDRGLRLIPSQRRRCDDQRRKPGDRRRLHHPIGPKTYRECTRMDAKVKPNREWTRINANKNLMTQRDIGGTNGEKCRAPHLRISWSICGSGFTFASIRVHSRFVFASSRPFAVVICAFLRLFFREAL